MSSEPTCKCGHGRGRHAPGEIQRCWALTCDCGGFDDDPTAPPPAPPTLTEALLEVAGTMQQILEACNGYRAQLQEAGYSSAVVDAAVVAYHQLLLAYLHPSAHRRTT